MDIKLYSVFYYDLTGARGVVDYDAKYEIEARDKFLAQHPNCTVNYIELKKPLDYYYKKLK